MAAVVIGMPERRPKAGVALPVGKAFAAVNHGLNIMRHPIAHYMSEHFPDLDHPKYQAAFERMTFVYIAAMLIGLFGAVLVLLASAL